MGFAENLGVIINMKDRHRAQDEHFDREVRQDSEYRCFQRSIPLLTPLQATGFVAPQPRSYWAKYPGETGGHLRELTQELLDRIAITHDDVAEAAAPAEGKKRAMWTSWKERKTAHEVPKRL
jgi:chromosome partitioning protein